MVQRYIVSIPQRNTTGKVSFIFQLSRHVLKLHHKCQSFLSYDKTAKIDLMKISFMGNFTVFIQFAGSFSHVRKNY